jgi:hypothetical protein
MVADIKSESPAGLPRNSQKFTQRVDVSQLQTMLEGMLAKQLVAAVNSAGTAT